MQLSQHFGSDSCCRPEQAIEFFEVCPAACLSWSTSYLHFAFLSLYRSSLSLTAHTSSIYFYFSLPPHLTSASSSLLYPLVFFFLLFFLVWRVALTPYSHLFFSFGWTLSLKLSFSSALLRRQKKERKTQFVFRAMSVMWGNREGEGETGRWAARRGGLVKVTVWWLVKCIWHKGRCLGAFAHMVDWFVSFFLLVSF